MEKTINLDLYKRLMESNRVKTSKVPLDPHKYIPSLLMANTGNLDFLDANGIELVPSEWIVLTIEPETLQKTVLRAKDLGFIDAYIQNPSFLKQDVEKVVRRMGASENAKVPYKNDRGKYQSFIFSERGFNYVIKNQTNDSVNTKESVVGNKQIDLRTTADRIMETFALTNERENIYHKLAEATKLGLNPKDTLMEAFKDYGNENILSASIAEILSQDEEYDKGSVAR